MQGGAREVTCNNFLLFILIFNPQYFSWVTITPESCQLFYSDCTMLSLLKGIMCFKHLLRDNDNDLSHVISI